MPINRSRTINDSMRGRIYLREDEVIDICNVVRQSRYPERNILMILMTFFHGLRPIELLNLHWSNINMETREILINRLNNGINSVHSISNQIELKLLTPLHNNKINDFIFINERGGPVSLNTFQKMFNFYSTKALGVKWNPFALRNGCGVWLVEQGYDIKTIQIYMGVRNIANVDKFYQILNGKSNSSHDTTDPISI